MSFLNEQVDTAAVLQVHNLRKSFFGVEILKGVSFTLRPGHSLGLIGENGSGKSTTANIINGLLKPSEGTMRLDRQTYAPNGPSDAMAAGIGFIHQELNLFENLTVAENISLRAFPKTISWLPQINRRRMKERARNHLAEVGLEIDVDTPLSRLAQGERQLVEIAKALSADPKIIIFDEPTTSLTTREATRLFDLIARLKNRGIATIYISHILTDVLRLCDEVVILRDGNLVENISTHGLTVPHMIESVLGRPLADLFPERTPKTGAPAPLLEVRGLSQPGIVADLTFSVGVGEIVGIAGLMGSGRSEMARVLFGLDPAVDGEVAVGGGVVDERSPRACMAAGMALMTEDRRGDGLLMPASILANLTLAKIADVVPSSFSVVPEKRLEKDAREIATGLRIKAHDLDQQPVRSLSGGNQQKVVLGKWLLRAPKVLILDEPTRGIDVGAKAEIYAQIQKLARNGAAVLVIASEFEELFGICDRILAMAHGEIVAEFSGPVFDREAVLAAAMQTQAEAS
jgi:ribose transport system ATP-binding protein